MDDLSGKISEILGNPAAMAQIQGLASMLGMQGSSGEGDAPAQEPTPAENSGGSSLPDLSGLLQGLSGGGQSGSSPLGALSGLLSGGGGSPPPVQQAQEGAGTGEMMQAILRMAPLLGSLQQETDGTRLLRALRPLLSEKRRKKLDEALKLMQLTRVLPLLKGSGLF